MKWWNVCWVVGLMSSCSNLPEENDEGMQKIKAFPAEAPDTIKQGERIVRKDTGLPQKDIVLATSRQMIETKNVSPEALVSFAEKLVGTPYKYGSINPHQGFDCSGFITYVFNHFGIQVPRSSVDYTNVGREISSTEAKRGDLILFTGTDASKRIVGHMGIIISNEKDTLQFIHSSSGKAYGVIITPLNGDYDKRYMKTIRVFNKNGQKS